MNIGDKVLIKGEIVEIIQKKNGYYIKVKPDYEVACKDDPRYDLFTVQESAVINETDQVERMAIDYGK